MLGVCTSVTETGSLLVASFGGTQLGPYVSGQDESSSSWDTEDRGDLEDGLRPDHEYSFPLEDARAEAAYGIHSAVNKDSDHQSRDRPGSHHGRFVDEVLGF